MDRRELRQAALHVLNPQFRASATAVEIGVTSLASAEAELQKIVEYKKWADGQDRDVRKAYYYWLDHFERQAKAAIRAAKSGARERWEEKRRRNMEEFYRIREISIGIPRPHG